MDSVDSMDSMWNPCSFHTTWIPYVSRCIFAVFWGSKNQPGIQGIHEECMGEGKELIFLILLHCALTGTWVLSDGSFFAPYISFPMFFAFNCSFTLFGIMCPISPCSTEFSAFYEHFCRFLKFLTLMFQKVFCNYLMFACVWHHDSCMIMIT